MFAPREAFICLLLALCGCATPRPPGTAPLAGRGSISELNVITSPVGLNLDDRPGPDGFSLKVYASEEGRTKAVPIRSGTLEILMWNGTFFGRTSVPPALKIWAFKSDELIAHEFTAGLGTGYDFVLAWGTNRPSEPLITVAARYTSAQGDVVTSRPSSVAVVGR